MHKGKKKSIRKLTCPINLSRRQMSGQKIPVRSQSRTFGLRAIDVSEIEALRTAFKTRFDTSRIDDLEGRGAFEMSCSNFEDLPGFGETEATTEDALEEIFLPEFVGTE